MAAAGPLGMEGVDRAAANGPNRVLHEARLVEGVGVDAHLHVVAIGDAEAAVDRRRGGAPVFMQLQGAGSGADLFLQSLWGAGIALAKEAQVDRQTLRRLQHSGQVKGARGAGGGVGAGGRAGAAPQQGGHPGGQGRLNLLGADEVNMGIDGASGEDVALAGDGLGAGTHNYVDAVLNIGVTSLADRHNAAIAQTDVRLDNPPPIQDQGVGDHRVHGPLRPAGLGLAHAIANHLATAELHLVAVAGEVFFHLQYQLGVGQAQPITGGGAVGFGVGAAGNPVGHGGGGDGSRAAGRTQSRGPLISPLKPTTRRPPT